MAKYIIDLPEDTTRLNVLRYRDGKYVSARSYIIPELIPYVRSESYLDGLKKGQNEVWEFVQGALIAQKTHPENLKECYNGKDLREVVLDSSYSEAKTKYDKWEKEKSRICVGDEVIIKSDGVKGVILDEDLCGEFSVFTENGCCEAYRKIHFEKTGRHLNSVEKLLEEMRNE